MGLIRAGSIGLFIECHADDSGGDRILSCDLDDYPWPIADATCERVVAERSLDRIDDAVHAMEEIWRISKHGAVIEITAEHFSRARTHADPDRRRFVSYRTVNFFCENVAFGYKYYSKARFELVDRRIVFGPGVARRPIEALANHAPRTYEHFLALAMPAESLRFTLRAIKNTEAAP